MAYDNSAFRAQYRAQVSPWYSPWAHAAFVLLYGAAGLAFFWAQLRAVQALEWLTIPLALVLANWGEYTVHKRLGHHKHRLGALFYKRHTGDHHSFFVPGRMRYETAQDWRVILFPPWLIVLFSVGLLGLWWLLAPLNGNVAALLAGTLLFGYLCYEILHACEHLPESHPAARLPGLSQMRRLHALHHRRDLMQTHNFNIVFPLMDWLHGTLLWEPAAPRRRARRASMTVMRHRIQIARPPAQVMAFACAPKRWPAWHPSSLSVEGPDGPLPAGSGFEEEVLAGGRGGRLRWEVLEYRPGERWQARAQGPHGLELRLTYQCRAAARGSLFIRHLEYRFPGWRMRLANALLLRQRILRESEDSLRILRDVIEERIADAEHGAAPATSGTGTPAWRSS